MLADALSKRPHGARILVSHRMHCVGCTIAPFETLAEACDVYGISVQHLLRELNGVMTENDNEQ